MGYTSETLPADRAGFWGGRMPPINGIEKHQWWPTAEEERLIDEVVLSPKFKRHIKATFGEENANQICEQFDEYAVFRWFTENFTRQEFTNDYRLNVTKDMVLRGIKSFEIEVVTPWLLNN